MWQTEKIHSQAVKASTSYITVARNGSIMIDHAAWNKSSLLLWIFFTKHTSITTIYNQYLNGNYLQKLLKRPST